MSVGVLLITHPGIGSSLLHIATRILSDCPLRTKCLEVPPNGDTDQLLAQAAEHLAALDEGQGVLILTDIFGATPSNIGREIVAIGRASMVSGVNLPMLLRVFNYSNENLETLCIKASESGNRGIQVYSREEAMKEREAI